MELKAICMGAAVPRRNFDAAVHSVFPEAANLRLGKGSRLLTLVTVDCADLPQGIRIDTPPGFSFEAELHPSERLTCRSGVLRDEQGPLEINLRQAKRWKCQLPHLDEISPTIAAAWTSVWRMLNERQGRASADVCAAHLLRADIPEQSAVARKMGALVRELFAAARCLDLPPAATVSKLIGLGSGLTPSGDDFLVGFLAGLCCMTGSNAQRRLFLSGLGKAVVRLSHRTNIISRTYLFHAARRQVSSRLVTLAEAIAGGDNPAVLLQAAEDIMRVGHSSGADMVTGLLIGLSVWSNGLLPV